jgi:hypothetical protein
MRVGSISIFSTVTVILMEHLHLLILSILLLNSVLQSKLFIGWTILTVYSASFSISLGQIMSLTQHDK